MSEGTVRCNVCGSPYTLPEDEIVGNLPHVLLCSHIFCTACLRALESPQTIITCPECQMDTNVGEEGVDGLQVDSRIIGLIYTARMNAKKGRSGDRRKCQRVKSPPPASGAVQTQGTAEGKSDLRNSLDEALSKATDNLNQLDTLHQTLVRGIHSQLRNERTRIKREIDEAVDKAISILHKRRSVLVSNLSVVELLFSDGQKECERIEKRVKELSTAIQKARHVRQVPSLETYCDVDEVLEILQIPVDVESYDMSALSLRSGLSCRFQVESLTESVKNCLKITDDNDTVLEEVALKSTRCLGKKEPPEKCKDVLDIPCDPARANQRNQSSPDPIPTRKSTRSPNFMQEIMEDIEPCSEIPRTCSPPVAEPRHKERHKVQRRHRRPQFDKPFSQPKILHEWVMVTHIVNPEHFYVRYMMEHKSGLKLTKKIKAFCSGEQSHFTFSDEIKTGSLLFVRWKEDMWCRVTVSEVFRRDSFPGVTKCPASEVSHLRVFFQDYGFSKGLSLAKDQGLRGLNESLRRPDAAALSEIGSWVPQAIRCSLKDIIPADLGKGWSSEASDEMRRLLGSNTVEMQVFGDDGDTLLVDLKKTHMVSLRDHLVFMELARFYSPMAAPGVGTPLLFYPPVPPKLHVELCAVVSYVNTPSDFYIQLVDNMEFLLLHAKLQDCYGPTTKDSEFQVYCASLYQACVALCDEEWSRAQVTGFQGGRMVEVRYVDFGNRKTVSVKDLRQIKDEFFALPEMAVWCSLSDLVSVEDTWSDEACKVFKELTENKLVTVVAKKLVPSTRPVPICMLEISEDCTAANIGEILVGKGLASFSKQPLVKDPQPVETAVWDPPFEEELLSAVDQTPSPPVTEELKPNLILPACVKDLRVRVTHVTSPANICVQLLQSDGQLKRIHDLLKSLYSKSEPQEVDWEPEMFCAANNTGVWERGQVCSLSSNSTAEIFRCDFGNKMKFHVNNLRPLRSDLIGSYSLECCLSGIRPAGGRSTWTATACDFISHYLTGATAIMTLKEPSSARPVPVSMYCSNGAGQSVSITDFLISEGLALKERNPSYEKAFPESEDCVIEEIIEIQGTESPPQTPQTPPTPAPRINPPPERVRTHAYPPPELPPCGHLLMNISAISEQGVIYAMTPQAVCEFDRLRERLQQHIKSLPRQKNYNWRGVLGCAVMGTDMLWYRGQVQEVIGGHVKVRYVDQGLVESIPVCHVYPKVLCEDVPQLCVPCQIHGVIPIGKGWQWDAVVLMRELLLGRSVNVHVMEHPEDPSGCVTVKIMVDGMPLSKIMVHHQYATFDPTISSEEDYVVKPPFPDLDDWDLNTEGFEEPQPVLGVYTERKLPPKGKHFRVKVKHIRTPNEVFLCPLNNTACKQDEEISLEEALARVNENVENLAKLTDFPIEGSCLAEYSDGKYYRAKLMGFSELSPTVKILVRHVDFGSDDILPIHKLRQLPTSLLDFPCAAAYVQLVGFKPPRVCMEAERVSYRPEWSMRAMLEMIDLLNRDLSAVVTATEPQVKVLLYNMDGSLLHTPLVEKGLADYD